MFYMWIWMKKRKLNKMKAKWKVRMTKDIKKILMMDLNNNKKMKRRNKLNSKRYYFKNNKIQIKRKTVNLKEKNKRKRKVKTKLTKYLNKQYIIDLFPSAIPFKIFKETLVKVELKSLMLASLLQCWATNHFSYMRNI